MSVSTNMKMAINALKAAGIPVQRGYPDGKLPSLRQPEAAITIERSDTKQTELAVWIFSPIAVTCEDTAQIAADALRKQRAFCQVEKCQYDGRSNLFSVKIQAVWQEKLINQLKLNQNVIVYATEFSAVQTRQVQQLKDEETGQTQVVNEEVVWTIAVQEQLPFREVIEVEGKGAFTLTVTHENYVEIYPNCYWLSITLEENGAGLLRKRIARSWTERIVEYEDEQT